MDKKTIFGSGRNAWVILGTVTALLATLVFGTLLASANAAEPTSPLTSKQATDQASKQAADQAADLASVWGSETVWPSDASIWPGTVFLADKKAQAITVGKQNRIPGAISRCGRGRTAVFGHTSFVDPGGLLWTKSAPLAVQLTQWLANRSVNDPKTPGKIRLLACQTHNNIPLVEQQGFEIKAVQSWSEINWDRPDFDVLVCYTWNVPEDLYETIQKFVRAGGGLLTACTPWVKNSPRFKSEFPSNRFVRPFGVVFTTNGAETTVDQGFAKVEVPDPNLNLANAIEQVRLLLNNQKKQKDSDSQRPESLVANSQDVFSQAPPQVWQTIREGLIWTDDLDLTAVFQDVKKLQDQLFVSEQQPIKAQRQPLEQLIATWQTLRAKDCFQITDNSPNPVKIQSADEFPGTVPDTAKRVRESVSIDCSVPDWSSTGLYAPAGETITLRVPKSVASQGHFAVRIGCHRDTLWHLDVWKRYPEITFEAPLNATTIQVNSAFGGLVYIVVPNAAKTLGTQTFEISGAIKAPLFVLGKTTAEQWGQMKRSSAPWGELASTKLIISVPQEVYKTVDDPEKVMRYWDRVLDADAEFIGRPLDRIRPERMVCDVQISAGYMHSGYPVMTWMDVRHRFVSAQGDWGFYHELGHNHQSRDWTFSGAGEVTVNWFTMYCFETIDGTPQDGPQGRMNPEEMARIIARHKANGSTWESWTNDPFIGLAMFVELKQKYGWDLFKKLIADYNSDKPENRPKNDDQIRDQMLVRMSRITGDDLGPFFQNWGVPTSDKARAEAGKYKKISEL